jgi:hypothetical protein
LAKEFSEELAATTGLPKVQRQNALCATSLNIDMDLMLTVLISGIKKVPALFKEKCLFLHKIAPTTQRVVTID